ncbi:DUF4222 domain-containing protein [Enterobacter cancerogenus]|uniref:DUF4222 domain-containing protein n=1 Tax=Enterobacter cancerogenus TaxID=69218 RepID=UPI003F51CAF5
MYQMARLPRMKQSPFRQKQKNNTALLVFLRCALSRMRCDMSHPITTENQVKPLDIDYRDPRCVIVHVTGWNRDKQQVYFTRQNYPHECMQPVWKFQNYFRRVGE